MCGRDYSTYTDEELAFRYFNRSTKWRWPAVEKIPQFSPSYNFCPTQLCPILRVRDEHVGFELMRWGLVPSWAGSISDADKYSMINAKAEEVDQKRSYKSAFRRRRCIVPVSGFYEWKKAEPKKIPFAIYLKDETIMSIAGIWEEWIDKKSGEVVDSFSMITTKANRFMEPLHHRMPYILDRSQEEAWLDPETGENEALKILAKEPNSEIMAAHKISTLVNSPGNNGPELLAPVE